MQLFTRAADRLLYTAVLLLFIVCATPAVCDAAEKLNCGASTSSKHIQLVQPTNPPRECIYHIKAYSNNVCQLRIDFSMVLAQPSIPNGQNGLWYVQCVRDYFTVNELKLCGTETAQHIYVAYNRSAGVKNVELRIVLATRNGANENFPKPSWNMELTQLECSPRAAGSRDADFVEKKSEWVNQVKDNNKYSMLAEEPHANLSDAYFLAPPGCLQYFPQAAGTVTSFNYNGGVGIYSGNLNYAICFRRQQSTKLLELKARYFNLGADYKRQKFQELDNYCRPQLHSEGLSEDFLLIPQANIVDSNIRATYFCGSSIQGDTVTSTNPGPLLMIFNSDGNYKAGREGGFALSYRLV